MQLGFVGLGKMGLNMVTRLERGGHEIVAYDRSADAVGRAAAVNASGVSSLEALVGALQAPRHVWVMVPAGDPTESTVLALTKLLSPGDVIIDGGNTNFHDDQRRAKLLAEKQLHYIDAGTSGGIWGLTEGYCLMVGGEADICTRLEPIFLTLAPKDGYMRVGDHGAGHYVKMVHNGIEYGMMQAYAEGFSILQHKQEFALDLHQVAEIWRTGSVVRSWLLDLTSDALGKNPTMQGIAPWVADSGEGRWTLQEAIDLDVPAPVIALSLMARLRSRDTDSFTDKLLAAMRNEFGGHAIRKE